MTRHTVRGRATLAPIAGDGEAHLTGAIVKRLTQHIVTSRLQVGDELLSESAFADLFGVGARTVREALRVLAASGVVTTRRGKRAVVSDWQSTGFTQSLQLASLLGGDDHTNDLLEFRLTLEPRAAALAALRHGSDDALRIQAALRRMEEQLGNDDAPARWADADLAFHHAVVRASHNHFIEVVTNSLSSALRMERISGAEAGRAQGRDRQQTILEHSAVSDAVLRRDASAAEKAMLQHLRDSLTYFLRRP